MSIPLEPAQRSPTKAANNSPSHSPSNHLSSSRCHILPSMQSTRMSYKTDDYGNPMYARVSWSTATQSPKPIGKIKTSAHITAIDG